MFDGEKVSNEAEMKLKKEGVKLIISDCLIAIGFGYCF